MNLGQFLRTQAAARPDATALFCGARHMTYAELDASSSRLAAWLLAQGLQRGDRVAIQWPNAIEVVQIFFAAFKAGLIAVPVNLRLKPSEVAWVLDHAGASICFAPPALAEAAKAAGVRTLTALPPDSEGSPHAVAAVPLPDVAGDEPALLIYTSGSTGRPKGAVLTHQIALATAHICMQSVEDVFGAQAGPRTLLMTPLMHSSGLYVLLGSMRAGEASVLLPAFEPGAALDAIAAFKCTLTLALPVLMQFMLQEQERQPRELGSLRVVFAGGDSVPVALQERMQRMTGATVIEGLAQSETGPSIVNPMNAARPGSLGRAHDGVELRIVDPDGRPVPEGQVGELLVRSPAVCAGYWRDQAATDAALQDGWFRTGDLVSRDTDGYYWFRGRVKEIIVRGGSNISPQEVEEAIYGHPAVLEAGVIGMPDEVWGEVVIAVVALRDGATATEDELREHARQTLADYKVPERVHILTALPKGPTGKVHRRALREALTAAPPVVGA